MAPTWQKCDEKGLGIRGSGSFGYETVESGMRWAGGQGQNSVMVISDFLGKFHLSGSCIYSPRRAHEGLHEGPHEGPTWGPAAVAEGLRIFSDQGPGPFLGAGLAYSQLALAIASL